MDLINKSFEYVKRRCNEDNKDITRKAFLAGARSFYEEFDVDEVDFYDYNSNGDLSTEY